MSTWTIVVASFEGQEQTAMTLRQRLAQAWRGAVEASFECRAVDQLRPEELASVDGVVLVAGANYEPASVIPLLARLEDAGVPVLALVDGSMTAGNAFEFGGALVQSHATDELRLCAMLRALLHRQKEIDLLRREITIAQRCHGGLEGEITRIHEELQLAAMVQREFLPSDIPSRHGVDVAALWLPTNYVSGDIYDVARLDEDHLGIFVADAVGHGVPAALMTMVICRSLKTREIVGAAQRLLPPAEVLGHLNQELIRRQGTTTRFATAVYALVNCRSRKVWLAGAGHPPPLLFRPDGSSKLLESNGGLLGIFQDEVYEQIELDLAVDDCIIFYSDGFEQAFPEPDQKIGSSRLPTLRYLEEFRQLPKLGTAQRMIESISHRINDQRGSLHQADDLTLVCMHAGPLAIDLPDGDLRERELRSERIGAAST